MSFRLVTSFRTFTLCLALAASGAALHAQTLTGALSDDTTGPVTPGVHVVNGFINIASGKTLTVQAGAILKFNGAQFTLDGTLNVQGTSGSPVIFTSLRDDTAGGDTNGDGGATTPAPSDWQGVTVHAGATASVLNFCDVRYAGAGGWTAFYVNQAGCNFTLNHCTIRSSSQPGINFNNLASLPTVSNCTFTNNLGIAVDGMVLQAVPGFSNNTASGNVGNYMRVNVANLAAPLSITSANIMNGALVVTPIISIAAGSSLTFGPGCVVKVAGAGRAILDGPLFCNGTLASPVVFTSFADDTVAGDTNNDSNATAPAAGDWQGMEYHAGSTGSVLNFTEVRYAGAGGWAAAYVDQAGASFTLSHCTFRNSSQPAINLNSVASFPTVSNCAFNNNGGPAVTNLLMQAVPGFSANTATGNVGNYMLISVANLAAPLSIVQTNILNGALVVVPVISINTGSTLTLGAGCVLKSFFGNRVVIDGQLFCNGTSVAPVVFTSIADDTAAGDTNNDGNATSPAAGNWQGIEFHAGSTGSVLNFADIRYSGSGGWTSAYVDQVGANFTLTNCTIRDSSQPGINLTNTVCAPTIANCNFVNNAGAAADNVRLESVPGFSNNNAAGNAGGNYLRITDGSVTSNITLSAANCLRGSLVMAGNIVIGTGGTLHLFSGAHVKMPLGGQVTVSTGTMDFQGATGASLVFTSIRDDSVDGDTNLDGTATTAAKGDWLGLIVNATAAGATLNHAVVRYAGAGGWAGLWCDAPVLSAHVVRTEHDATDGFHFSAAGSTTDLVAWDCNGNGFQSTNAITLDRCTAVANGASGFLRNGLIGSVRNSIAFGNLGPGGDFNGFTPGSLFFSDGSATLAGSNGNVNVDPRFVSAATGDFTLQKISPCIDAADPAEAPTGTDDAGYPRLMDGNFDKLLVVDMGAYEFDNVHLKITGSASPGGTLNVITSGTTGLTTYLFIGLTPAETPLKAFGPLFMSFLPTYVLLPWAPIPSTIPIAIPASLPTPLPIIFQELGIQGSTGHDPGNLSNPVYVTIK